MTSGGQEFTKNYEGALLEAKGIAANFGRSAAGPYISVQSTTKPTARAEDLIALHAKRMKNPSPATNAMLATDPVKVYVHYALDVDDTFRALEVGKPIRAIGVERVFDDRVGIALSELISQPASDGGSK